MSQPPPAAPQPDTKDWTWTLQRVCPECGFDAAAVEPVAIPALVRDAVSRWPDVLARRDAAQRPTPTTWSPLEYGAHVRDVCRIFTTRVQLMLDEDDPRFANWDQDETALADRYDRQDPATVSAELAEAGEALAVAYTRVGARRLVAHRAPQQRVALHRRDARPVRSARPLPPRVGRPRLTLTCD